MFDIELRAFRVDQKAKETFNRAKRRAMIILAVVLLVLYFLEDVSVREMIMAIGTSSFIVPLGVEALNMISDFTYDNLRTNEAFVLSGILAVVGMGIMNIPIIGQMPFLGYLSGVSVIVSVVGAIYIILPGKPIVTLPYGFLMIWAICFVLVHIGGIL